jgi:hypothetical protein
MDFDKYINLLPYDNYRTDVGYLWRKEQNKLKQSFFDDMAEELGYTDNPKRKVFEEIVWSRGHSAGYKDVYEEAIEILPLIK